MKKFENLGRSLNKEEQKKIKDGVEPDPIGDGFSCECKDGHSAGMVSCDTCERYCSTDNSYGGKKSCD